MISFPRMGIYVLFFAFGCLFHALPAFSQTAPGAASAEQNGQHDFDFNFGTWKTHVSRLEHPLTGSHTWVQYDGISVVRKVWDGRASLFELEADGPAGHIEGVGLRLYNPQSHQWSLNWANSHDGTLEQPMIGEFRNGRGEFYDQEIFSGRVIFIRNGFSDITPNSSRFEQAFSDYYGKTWETNWIMTFTRMKEGLDETTKTAPLTEKDIVVLADFDNKTGDAVFDDTLKQALAIELGQSPFLNVLSDRKVSETLRMMGRAANERVTADVGRELCLRTDSKAVLSGTISNLGSHYLLTLSAIACSTGEILAKVQSEATSKTGVLKALSQASSSLRAKLGEPLSSVQKFDVPIEFTTSTLEAIKNYSIGVTTQRKTGDTESIPFLKRAIELDPNFPMAYALLAGIYGNLRQPSLALEYATKAYQLRDRVTEREKLRISAAYFLATGALEKEIQTYELWTANYPRDYAPFNNLGNDYAATGQLDKALVEYQKALQLTPTTTIYSNVGGMYLSLNRFDEAKATLDEAIARNFGGRYVRQTIYWLAFLQGDVAQMAQQVAWAAGKPGDEDALLTEQSDTEAYYGRLSRARKFTQRAVDSAVRAGSKETAALWQVNAALREAELGNLASAREGVTSALALSTGRDVTMIAAFTLARTGDTSRAEALAEKLEKDCPTDTLMKLYWLPTIHAAIALDQGNSSQALEDLKTAAPYELGGAGTFINYLYPAYVRGQAYLLAHNADAAAAEFEKLLYHRGIVLNFVTGALAHLQLGRAYAMAGETARAKAAYLDFFTAWKGADPDIPILKQAKAEYAKFQQSKLSSRALNSRT